MLHGTEDAIKNVFIYNPLFVTVQNKYIFLHLLHVYEVVKFGQESVTIFNTLKKEREENEKNYLTGGCK